MSRCPGAPLAILWLAMALLWSAVTVWTLSVGGLLGLWPVIPAVGSLTCAYALWTGYRWRRLTFVSFVLGVLFVLIFILAPEQPMWVPVFGALMSVASVIALRGFERAAYV